MRHRCNRSLRTAKLPSARPEAELPNAMQNVGQRLLRIGVVARTAPRAVAVSQTRCHRHLHVRAEPHDPVAPRCWRKLSAETLVALAEGSHAKRDHRLGRAAVSASGSLLLRAAGLKASAGVARSST